MSRLRERGVEIVGQYTGDNRWNNYYYKIQDVFDTLWIARWNTNEGFYTGWEVEAMRKSDKVDLHQYTSQANAKEYGCPGITTRVDMSRLTGTKPLEWFTERLQNAEAPTITPTIGDGTVAVTGSTVNVRSGPGTAYDVVSVAHKGDTLKRADCDGWVPVIVDGKVCWISGEYVKSHVES